MVNQLHRKKSYGWSWTMTEKVKATYADKSF